MAKYQSDRTFTDYIHQNLATKIIYQKLGWEAVLINNELAENLDINKGIDYCFKDQNGKLITIQERFREQKYKSYNDITFRYRRDKNYDESKVKSEFFKIQANYMIYGVIDVKKWDFKSARKFLKFAVIDLKVLFSAFNNKIIKIVKNKNHQCFLDNGTLVCPINFNRDGSSSFVPIDIVLLSKLDISKDIIFLQEGYF